MARCRGLSFDCFQLNYISERPTRAVDPAFPNEGYGAFFVAPNASLSALARPQPVALERMLKRSPQDEVGGEEKRPRREDHVELCTPTFKLLAPKTLASAIQFSHLVIENAAQGKLHLTEPEDMYPGTEQQVVTIESPAWENIASAMKHILAMANNCTECVMPGHEDERRLAIVMPSRSISALIGVKGANVKELQLRTGCHIHVDDVAIELLQEIWQPLQRRGHCESVDSSDSATAFRFLPWALGDGSRGQFRRCSAAMTSSMLEPNIPLLRRFVQLEEVTTVVERSEMATRRLDDLLPEIPGGAQKALQDTLVVHTEVEFVEMYERQPLFAEVDQFLRGNGFVFHRFSSVHGRPMKPLHFSANPLQPISQQLWADAVYVKDMWELGHSQDSDMKEFSHGPGGDRAVNINGLPAGLEQAIVRTVEVVQESHDQVWFRKWAERSNAERLEQEQAPPLRGQVLRQNSEQEVGQVGQVGNGCMGSMMGNMAGMMMGNMPPTQNAQRDKARRETDSGTLQDIGETWATKRRVMSFQAALYEFLLF
eukprot:s2379_g4.t4